MATFTKNRTNQNRKKRAINIVKRKNYKKRENSPTIGLKSLKKKEGMVNTVPKRKKN